MKKTYAHLTKSKKHETLRAVNESNKTNGFVTQIQTKLVEMIVNSDTTTMMNLNRVVQDYQNFDQQELRLIMQQLSNNENTNAMECIIARPVQDSTGPGLHLTHGIHSMSRTIGISNPVWTERAGKAAVATGVGITAGNIAIVLFGMIAG